MLEAREQTRATVSRLPLSRAPVFRLPPSGVTQVAVPLFVFVLHALCFRAWIVDDAGISFVYARNLATGHGLVSQPGMPPVEGYSNPLWVLLAVPFYALGMFHPIVTPKLLSLLLVAAAFVLLQRSLDRFEAGAWLAPIALTLVALNTSFVVWTTSGLENPLYVFLLCLLFHRLLATGTGSAERPAPAVTGLVAGAIALTRPEGVLFAALYPLARASARGLKGWRQELAGMVAYGAAFGLLAGGHLAFRWFYFGDLMPNTYYAKGGPETGDFLLDALELLSSVGSRLGFGLALALIALSWWLAKHRQYSFGHRVLGLFVLFSALAHLLLPPDWMGEYRFATPFFVFFYAYAVAIFTAALEDPSIPKPMTAVLLVAALVAQVSLFAPRSASFALQPTVPFTYVAERFAAKFDQYATRLGVADGSLLLPDVGATLYYSKLRIHDLGGLTDAVAARTFGPYPAAFRDYVFEQMRPTFIHLHEPWAAPSGFDLDPRFRRDYLAIVEYGDGSIGPPQTGPFQPGPLQPEPLDTGSFQPGPFQIFPRAIRNGDFVRRDAVSDPAQLQALQRENAGLRP